MRPRCCELVPADLQFLTWPVTPEDAAAFLATHHHRPWRHLSCLRAETRALREPIVYVAAGLVGLLLARVVVR